MGRKERRKEGKKGERERKKTLHPDHTEYTFSQVYMEHDHTLAHKENNLAKFKIEI